MAIWIENLSTFSAFLILCIASNQVGQLFAKIKMPVITGYLFLGLLVGPNVLGFISLETVSKLTFIDEIALSFIAFTAGSELFWKDIKPKLHVIKWLTICIILATFSLCSYTFYLLSSEIPFMQEMPQLGKVAVSLLAGTILVARSPSSAIAVVNELKAKGPFTQVALGVTVMIDIAVIVLFTITESVADIFLTSSSLNFGVLMKLVGELLLALIFGLILSKIIELIVSGKFWEKAKLLAIVSIGYLTYVFSHFIEDLFSLHIEPLLTCLICGFYLANFFQLRREFLKILSKSSPLVYIAFFTLTGASISLDVLSNFWFITIILILTRVSGIAIGSYAGGKISADKPKYNRIRWLCFITQAGVGLGLAKQVSDIYPTWGADFATILISVIIVNEIFGPIFFKLALNLAGEAKGKAKKSEIHTTPNAIIYGENSEALALSRQLLAHNWQVTLLIPKNAPAKMSSDLDKLRTVRIKSIIHEDLERIRADHHDTFVTMLDDKKNLEVAKLVSESFPDSHLVVALRKRNNIKDFDNIEASIVDPTTAFISLLDHYVRTPSAVSILLGYEKDHDILDCEVQNMDLEGKTLFELNLPADILILSIVRNGKSLDIHAGIRIEIMDRLTLIGSNESLEIASYNISCNDD